MGGERDTARMVSHLWLSNQGLEGPGTWGGWGMSHMAGGGRGRILGSLWGLSCWEVPKRAGHRLWDIRIRGVGVRSQLETESRGH